MTVRHIQSPQREHCFPARELVSRPSGDVSKLDGWQVAGQVECLAITFERQTGTTLQLGVSGINQSVHSDEVSLSSRAFRILCQRDVA